MREQEGPEGTAQRFRAETWKYQNIIITCQKSGNSPLLHKPFSKTVHLAISRSQECERELKTRQTRVFEINWTVLTHINNPISEGISRTESRPNDEASTPSPMQTGWISAAVCPVAVSGNAVKTVEDVTIVSASEVKVVEGLETVMGVEVVKVVRLELRNTEVALEDMEVPSAEREVDEVREDWGGEVGIADVDAEEDEKVDEEADERVEECVVRVGRKVEPSLVVHQRPLGVAMDMV